MSMQPVQKRLETLKAEVDAAFERLKIDQKVSDLVITENQLGDPDVWQNPDAAQTLSKNAASWRARTQPWVSLKKQANDLNELAGLDDESLSGEIESQVDVLENELARLKKDLMFDGPFDDHDAILRLSAG